MATVTLVATLCHALLSGAASPTVCVEEVVTDSHWTTLAGKVEAPVSMPGITWDSCLVGSQAAIAKWMHGHPIYGTGNWRLHSWKCVPGHYVPPHEI